MKKFCFLLLLFVTQISADSCELAFQNWIEYNLSSGELGVRHKCFDRALVLVIEQDSIQAKEFLLSYFPEDEFFINETLFFFEKIIEDLSNTSHLLWKKGLNKGYLCFSFTDYMMENKHREENNKPYSKTEVFMHLVEAVVDCGIACESIMAGSPWACAGAGISAVYNFQACAHKICENTKWENDALTFFDRTTDSEVR